MTVPGNIDALLLGGLGGYQIERSLRFNSADSAYLNRTYSGACQDAKLMTISVWVKRGKLTTAGQQPIFSSYSAVRFGGDLTWTAADKIQFRPGGNGDGASNQYSISTDAVFRDPSAWYHIVIQYDSTQATSTNRQKIYVNGVQQTVTGNYPTQNYLHTYAFNNANNQIGAYTSYGSDYLDSYLTEFHFIDGQALTPSSFGETDTITGVWKPKKYAGTYGTNGFYLKFADNSGTTSTTLGKDSSGNGNNWTPNNFSVTAGAGNDSLIDTPTPYADGGNGRGNYCTLNAVNRGLDATLSNGNLDISYGSSSSVTGTPGTIGVSAGKWYWEVTPTGGTGSNAVLGIVNTTANSSVSSGIGYYIGYTANGWGYEGVGGTKRNAGSTSYGATFTTNDVIGVAFDADNGTLTFYKNGVSQGQAFSGLTSGPYFPAVSDGSEASTLSMTCNFGQRAFAYTPPSGFLALNTQNLPEPTIKKPNQWMDATTYTGASANQSITNAGAFQPDLVWIKNRNLTAKWHNLQDSVRGSGYSLYSNATDVESNDTGTRQTTFLSNGFGLVGTNADTNSSTGTYVAWQWKKSATPGFDIVTYTGDGVAGRTVSHSLGVAPQLIIIKRRDAAADWNIYTTVIDGSLDFFAFTTAAKSDSAQAVPTSTVFSVSSGGNVNLNNGTYVAYCWAPVAGFSRFGIYTGNGSTDGPFVFTGHRSRFLLVKRTDAADSWRMYDTARNTYNAGTYPLYPNLSNAEDASTDHFDWLSNGFKCRSTNINVNGGTYIFAAFAESPFKYALAR